MRGHGQSTHSLPCSLCRSGRRLSSTGSRSAGVIVACGADLIVLEPARMLTLSKPQSIDASLEETYRYLLNSFEPICGVPSSTQAGPTRISRGRAQAEALCCRFRGSTLGCRRSGRNGHTGCAFRLFHIPAAGRSQSSSRFLLQRQYCCRVLPAAGVRSPDRSGRT